MARGKSRDTESSATDPQDRVAAEVLAACARAVGSISRSLSGWSMQIESARSILLTGHGREIRVIVDTGEKTS